MNPFAVEKAAAALLRLNLETQSHHATADQAWLSLQGRELTKWQYLRRLVAVYGFEAPLESALAYTPHLPLLVDLRRRQRAGYIAQDLLALGLSASEIAELPQCVPMAPFSSALEALGWLYVSERETLLHDRIRTRVLEAMPDLRHATAYLSAYDGVVGARWQELGAVIDRVVRSSRMLDEVIVAAHAAFRTWERWSRDDRASHARFA
ncbi:MAG: biliverdin-producing heme oxygenase [Kofleriaceae bacterium]|nr:biliverdin-producing heme oxygenase [Kofleriaceae bacterium]